MQGYYTKSKPKDSGCQQIQVVIRYSSMQTILYEPVQY